MYTVELKISGTYIPLNAHAGISDEEMEKARKFVEHRMIEHATVLERSLIFGYTYALSASTLAFSPLCHPSRNLITGLHRSKELTAQELSAISEEVAQEFVPVESDSVFSPRPAYVPVEVSNETV